MGSEARTQLALLETDAQRALGSQDPNRMRSVADDFDALYWRVVTEHPGFWVEQFIQLAEAAEGSSKSTAASPLLRRGRQALDRQDFDALRSVCYDLDCSRKTSSQPAA